MAEQEKIRNAGNANDDQGTQTTTSAFSRMMSSLPAMPSMPAMPSSLSRTTSKEGASANGKETSPVSEQKAAGEPPGGTSNPTADSTPHSDAASQSTGAVPEPSAATTAEPSNGPTRQATWTAASMEKLTAFQEFMQLQYANYNASSKKSPPPPFPPPHWEHGPDTTETAAATVPLPSTPGNEPDHVVAEQGSKAENASEKEPAPTSDEATSSEPAPEPATLAQRIKGMIDTLPPMPNASSLLNRSASSTSVTPAADTSTASNGAPDAPPLPQFVDTKLVQLLSSASVMNGSLMKGKESVWAALDKMRAGRKEKARKDASDAHEDTEEESSDEDEEDVMMYAPLLPGANSEVEVADQETVPGSAPPSPGGTLRRKKSKGSGEKKKKGKKGRKSKEHKVWIPSADKISIQASWWGYRLYLPPPVLDGLSDQQIEAGKRAAIITASLKWVLDMIPIMLFPPQLRASAMVLKRLTPFVGYIGAFVAWSWGAIKKYDEGAGVVLTATWLMPVALVPSTWNLNKVPVHRAPAKNDSNTSATAAKESNASAPEAADSTADASAAADASPPVRDSSPNDTKPAVTTTDATEAVDKGKGRAPMEGEN